MLLGTHAPKLDDKGRVIVPAKFRPDFAGGLVVTRGQERCLYVFSTEEFERVHERMREAPLANKQARGFLRMFLSGAAAEAPDSQHRVMIPAHLREYAGLGKDLIFTGVGTHAEIWAADAWNEYVAATESDFSDIEEEVIPGLF